MTRTAALRDHDDDEIEADTEQQIESHRRELTGFCYRMLGSGFEAEDAVQDTMVRAWRAIDRFEGRSSLRSWLYSIATNVCLDMIKGPQRRARPMDLSSPARAETPIGPQLAENLWVTPIADARVMPAGGDPAEVAVIRDSIRLAFIAALQHLPPRQRAVLILREVLCWQATEVAQLLDTTVASVNSALQRARASMSDGTVSDSRRAVGPISPDQQRLLDRYVDAFERYDVPALVALLRDDAIMSMPPYELWLQGPDDIGKWFLGQGCGCRGSRILPTAANGGPAFGSYRVDPNGGHTPWAIQVIDLDGDKIVGHHNFLDTRLFEAFGLPAHLD